MSDESLDDVTVAIEAVGADIGIDNGEQQRLVHDEAFRNAMLNLLESRQRFEVLREETAARALRFPRRQQTLQTFKKLIDMSAEQLNAIADALKSRADAKKQRDMDGLSEV